MAVDINDAIRLGFLLHDVARLQRVMQDRLLKPLGFTRAQWGVLTFLSRRDGMTQNTLAAELDLTKGAISSLLNRMETAEVIQRRPDEFDGRIRRVYLTRAGHQMLGQIRQEIERAGTKALGQNTDEQILNMIPTLRRMKASLLEITGEESDESKRKKESRRKMRRQR